MLVGGRLGRVDRKEPPVRRAPGAQRGRRGDALRHHIQLQLPYSPPPCALQPPKPSSLTLACAAYSHWTIHALRTMPRSPPLLDDTAPDVSLWRYQCAAGRPQTASCLKKLAIMTEPWGPMVMDRGVSTPMGSFWTAHGRQGSSASQASLQSSSAPLSSSSPAQQLQLSCPGGSSVLCTLLRLQATIRVCSPLNQTSHQ